MKKITLVAFSLILTACAAKKDKQPAAPEVHTGECSAEKAIIRCQWQSIPSQNLQA